MRGLLHLLTTLQIDRTLTPALSRDTGSGSQDAMPDNRDLYHRRTFWPRTERPELLGEVDLDRACPSCG